MSHPTETSRTGPAVSLSEIGFDRLEPVERAVEIRCATGDWWTADWRGPPVSAVVDRAAVPPETTHLVFETADGYRACLDVHAALDGVLAIAMDGEPLDAAERPRLVCPGVEGIRTVKGVSAVVPVSLSCDEDPGELEALGIGESDDAETAE
ncbi:molybdopterin-dependent oxidoreductase [Halorubrum sp. BOL3-1]|uniref:molybdopterin-dependent oxidoreductase n=1 Tax=Halorubrum sp. BOL3-1 TaxID=2497325 RepID=UPI0014082479|nr:molybdopterin-dependent oxidoreductase [Halorubrum sp. BOL3-1]